jgi:hypothetical protein
MTHDLMKNHLAELGTHVDRIVINDLRDNTFFARIHLTRGDSTLSVDSRPSDAIALALHSQAGIFVEEEVQEKSRNLRAEGSEQDRSFRWLEEAAPTSWEVPNAVVARACSGNVYSGSVIISITESKRRSRKDQYCHQPAAALAQGMKTS